MYGDVGWAQGWLGGLEPLRMPVAGVVELRAANVSEARIRNLYPPLEISEYVAGITLQLRNREVLKHVTDTLLMSQTSELLARLPPVKREAVESEIDRAANDLLDVILALPQADRPPQLVPRAGFYLADLNAACKLCGELFSLLKALGFMAADDADFRAATTGIDLRVHHHRIRHLVQRLVG